MNDIITGISWLIRGEVFYLVFQIAIFVLFGLAFVRRRVIAFKESKGGLSASIIRGDKSMRIFRLVFIFGASLVFKINSILLAWDGFARFVYIIDVVILIYLCFLNSWSRNGIMHIYVYFSRLEEKLRLEKF